MKTTRFLTFLAALLAAGAVHAGTTTTVTYQGQLRQAGAPFTGLADLEFQLYDQATDGNPVGAPQSRPDWPVEDGLFQAELDFGVDAFTAQVRWLEVRVGGTPLSPRQAVRPSPMALFALAGNEGPQGPPGSPGDSHWVLDGNATYYTAGPVGIGMTAPASDYALGVSGGVVAQRGSDLFSPQLLLFETQPDGFARMEFRNSGRARLWSIATRSGGSDPTTGAMNFYNTTGGDLLTLRGDGPVGIRTTDPLAPLHLRSQDQWAPGVGTGRGDFYVGDGDVGLSMGVALGGGGRGVSRIWTRGGVENLFLGSAAYGTTVSILPGQVGIANSNPGNTLDVNGGVRIRGLAHGGAASVPVRVAPNGDLVTGSGTTQHIAIPAAAFRPDSDNVDFVVSQGAFVLMGAARLDAPVHLPHGATITQVQIWYEDNVPGSLELSLRECDHDTDFCGNRIFLPTAGAVDGLRSATFNLSLTIDNLNNSYVLSVFSLVWNGLDTRVNGARISYTLP
ncbi:hypothetical protein HFP89_02980 [Wenzhouxiangella sp. XN79A]|uniref:hypothetical protein n=1 Tax=Wenzhouxiangella sp. XN79A TaxID=2724193 RepID=UPI00144A9FAE|nr:hypothetical protein [Wenzhouxiangella sp. XN79A]NKI34129.1 hypothetical protein [Wenzhouxiangella sp. XN79A]